MKKCFSILTLSCFLLIGCTADTGKPHPLTRVDKIRTKQLPKVNKKLAAMHIQPGAHAYIRIFKEEHALETWLRNEQTGQYQLYKSYPICTYSGKLGPKLREGDYQSPEGFYDVTEDWLWPQSKYHLAMNIGFPNQFDQSHGLTGSHLMIHGGCKSQGCYAMTDRGIEEIYLLTEQSLLRNAQPVQIHIFPFRMTAENMARHAGSNWQPFWRNLHRGYSAFETTRVPPRVEVENGRYKVTPLASTIRTNIGG